MEPINLQLFDENNFVIEPQKESNNTKSLSENLTPAVNPLNQLEKTLSTIFPDNKEESKVNKARKILGETADCLTDEKIENIVTDFEYLIDTWMDLFEKKVFGGKTLKEIVGTSAYGNTK